MRLNGRGNSKLPWRKAGQPIHLVDMVDSDQEVVNTELSLSPAAGSRPLPVSWPGPPPAVFAPAEAGSYLRLLDSCITQ